MRGHIRRRGRSSWEIKYDIARTDGRRQTRYKAFKGPRREAQAELTRLLGQAQAGGVCRSEPADRRRARPCPSSALARRRYHFRQDA